MVNLKEIQSKKAKGKTAKETNLLDFLQKDIDLFGTGFSAKQKLTFFMELSVLVSAGIDIKSSLEIIEQEQTKPKLKTILGQIKQDLIKGSTFSKALQESKQFSTYEFFSIQIGEETGKMPEVLKELTIFYQNKIKQSRQMVSALTYPTIVLTTSFGAIFFMMNFIVPMFTDVFKRFGGQLPPITQAVLGLSEAIRAYAGIVLLVLVGLGIYFFTQREKQWFRKWSATIGLKLPVFGTILHHIYLARFSLSMHLLISSKIPLLKALELVQAMISFYPIEEVIPTIQKEILKGNNLHKSMSKAPIFPAKMVSLVKVGEEINQLENFFGTIAQQYQDETEHKTAMISSLLEPFLIIFLGLVVGVILVSMYLPLFQLSNNLG